MTNFDSLGDLVFSTDGGRVAKEKAQPVGGSAFSDGVVRIKRETKGRKGKGVTTVAGIAADNAELKRIAGLLKKHSGSGGAVKDGVIEIQGDKRDVVKAKLEKLGYQVKLAGG